MTGRVIDVPELRGGFSHLIAALAASGPSNVHGISLIDRGYADFRGKLAALGADFEKRYREPVGPRFPLKESGPSL